MSVTRMLGYSHLSVTGQDAEKSTLERLCGAVLQARMNLHHAVVSGEKVEPECIKLAQRAVWEAAIEARQFEVNMLQRREAVATDARELLAAQRATAVARVEAGHAILNKAKIHREVCEHWMQSFWDEVGDMAIEPANLDDDCRSEGRVRRALRLSDESDIELRKDFLCAASLQLLQRSQEEVDKAEELIVLAETNLRLAWENVLMVERMAEEESAERGGYGGEEEEKDEEAVWVRLSRPHLRRCFFLSGGWESN